jgi:hypothetical protein
MNLKRSGVITKLFTSRWTAALTCAVAAACLPVVARMATGPRGAVVNVRWEPSVDVSARQTLEARFRLLDGERLDGSTWRYDLVDPSPDIIGPLVRDPAVADTHHIDRARLALDGAERTTRRSRIAYGGALVALADGVAVALASVAALLTLVTLSHTVGRDFRVDLRHLLFRIED